MNQSGLIIPKGYINAFFDGYDNKDIRIRIVDEERLGSFYLTICDSNKRVFFLKNGHKDRIDLALLKDNSVEVGNYWIVVVYYSDGLERVSFLRNMSLSVPSEAKGKIYDKRRLYGEVKKYDKDILFLLCYETNQVLSLEVHNRLDTIYTNQLVGELIMTENEEEIDEETKKQLYVKIPRLDGYYVGLCNKNGEIIEYNDLEVYDRFAYMSFFVDLQEHKTLDGFSVVWKKDKIYYKVPLKFYKDDNYALISDAQYIDGILSFCVQYELNCEGLFSEAILRQQAEIWESKQDYIVNIDKQECKDGINILYLSFDTNTFIQETGKWDIVIKTNPNNCYKEIYVAYKEGLESNKFSDSQNTKYSYMLSSHDGRVQIEKKYGHNALFKKNLQKVSKTETLDDFLEISGNTPKGDMYAEYKQNQNGQLFIRLYQNMSDVIEAKVVMLHTQWMGVLFTQNLDVCYGQVREFEVNCPDIDTDNKFGKPINSVWFRVAIAIRTAKGIYYSRLVNYDLNTEIEREGNIYDIRKLYRKPIGKRYICGIEMTALPYYAENKCLSMKYVRNDQLFRSQFTNELINVSIKNDVLTVVMRCRECEGEYKGVLLEYRKVKEEDAETYLVSYESLLEKDGWYLMTTKIDLKKYYLRMLYWDIRCAFELEGYLYSVSCHSNNNRFLRKYKKIFVDRTYPNQNSILYPYATDNQSVALMHREECKQDHWQFRLKEKTAQLLYQMFKSHWDSLNIYLIFEKYCTMAQDNGYYFFKYCMDAKVEKEFEGKILYVIDPKEADWQKVLPYKKNVLRYLSLKHLIYLQACKLMISTDTKGHAYVWRSMGSDIKAMTYKKNLVFLQHGVTAFKRGHFERGTNVGCECFVTTSEFERDIIHNYLGYPYEEIPVTGFARWDVLRDKSEGHREILMMPTWRTWLDDAENEIFAESDYCKNYMALLNNPELDLLLKEHDLILNFYLHPKFRKFITEFSVVSDRIRLIPFGEEPLNELLMQCNLLITDFSSVAWDVYYMNKPVLFYHFDIEEASKTLGFYMDMKNDLFGDIAYSPDELMNLMEEYTNREFKIKDNYLQERNRFFSYTDNKNSERIWKAIQAREWK